LLAISPGGVREMLFSDSNYNLIWNKRKGFAKIAIEAKVVRILIYDSFKIYLFEYLAYNTFIYKQFKRNDICTKTI
jgi:hypothetical protein